MRDKKDYKKASDLLLSLLVLATAVSAAWLGLRSTAPEAIASSSIRSSFEEVLASIPEDAQVIVVDAGHGGFDGGATGSMTGIEEAELNLSVAKKLADELIKHGYYVIMTREDDNALADTKKADMQKRKELMQLDIVDLVVSIHMNKFKDSSVSGPMVFYMKNSDKGKALSECVMYSICSELQRPQRFTNPEDLFVLRVPFAPSILVECGFLSNAEDERLLRQEDYQAKLAKAIAAGISDYIAQTELSQDG